MVPVHELYEQDYAAWAERNAELLRAGQLGEADLAHIAEELDCLSGSERRALRSHLTVLLAHLLKWKFQPDRRGQGWRLSVLNARQSILDILEDSPSLRPVLERGLSRDYGKAVRRASLETDLASERFPATCPYSLTEILDQDYLPE